MGRQTFFKGMRAAALTVLSLLFIRTDRFSGRPL